MVKQLIAEMKALEPVLLEPPAPTRVRWEPADTINTVQVRAIRRGDSTFLLAANAAEIPATVRVALPATVGPQAPVWFEDRAVQTDGRGFTDRFEPHETHVYEVHGQWPAKEGITLQVRLDEPGREPPVLDLNRFEENLIADPGFEGDASWEFRVATEADMGDIAARAVGAYDGKSYCNGRRAVAIEHAATAKPALWRGQPVALKPNSRYIFGAWARAETVGDAGVLLQLTGAPHQTQMRVSDHAPWRQYTTTFATGAEPIRARPVCRFHWGEGKAWFDDMFLVEAPPGVRNMVMNGGFEGRQCVPHWPRGWWASWGLTVPGYVGGDGALWGTDAAEAFEGERCFRMTNRPEDAQWPTEVGESSQAPGHAYVSQELAPGTVLQAGKSYVFSAYMKASRAGPLVGVVVGDDRHRLRVTPTEQWERYVLPTAIENDMRRPAVAIHLFEEGTLWVDAVQLEEGTEATEYREWRD
jgi:hypothetical protein